MKQIEQTLTSMEVAEMVEKDHNKLLRDIRSYIEKLDKSKIGHIDFFTECAYIDTQNRQKPCYLVTKKGCEFIAHKLTGIKGTTFTAKYINRFHEMEQALAVPMTTTGQIQLLAKGYMEIEQRVDDINKDLQDFKQDLPLLAVECEKITKAVGVKGANVLGGKNSNAYKDKSLRSKVFRDIHNEAKRQFGVSTYKAIKRSQCDKAIEIIKAYKLPMALADEVKACNAQMNIKEAV